MPLTEFALIERYFTGCGAAETEFGVGYRMMLAIC